MKSDQKSGKAADAKLTAFLEEMRRMSLRPGSSVQMRKLWDPYFRKK